VAIGNFPTPGSAPLVRASKKLTINRHICKPFFAELLAFTNALVAIFGQGAAIRAFEN
jgi:hypothetical protein